MRRRVLIAAGLLLTGLVGLVVWQVPGPREPVFENRRLTLWLDHHVARSDAIPPYGSPGWKKADEALRHIGTNAIPTLLRMIRAKDPPPVVLKLIEFQRYRWTRINYQYARKRHEEAEYAFRVLGTNGVSAVPELIRIYEKAVSPSSQSCAAEALGHIGHGAQAALPALLQNFHHTNDYVRLDAVSAVLHIGGDPNIVVPALKGMLKDKKSEVRFNAVAGLRSFGAGARSAIPELLDALQDQDQHVKENVEDVLWGHVPEKIAKPLVVEESSPIVVGGTTVGFSHGGRRIALRNDGSYMDTIYTDVIGDEHTKRGNYTLNTEKTYLVLKPEGGTSQELFRVDYDGQQYWVPETDRDRITQPSESWLRQSSIKVVP